MVIALMPSERELLFPAIPRVTVLVVHAHDYVVLGSLLGRLWIWRGREHSALFFEKTGQQIHFLLAPLPPPMVSPL